MIHHITIASMLLAIGLLMAGCEDGRNSGESRIHGEAGVRVGSEDTSRIVPTHADPDLR